MARKFLTPIDLSKLELQNAAIQNLATAPSSPVPGQIYFDTTDDTLYFWDGTAWIDTQSAPSNITYGLLSARPAPGVENNEHIYFATDNGLTYISNGTAWTQLAAFGSGASSSVSITGTSTDGSSTAYARADHTHAGPGFGSPSSLSFGGSASDGSASTVSRSDHTHAMPAHDAAAHSGIKVHDLGLATASFNMNGQKITNLATPTADTDAANKGYVDNAIAGLSWKDSVHLLADTDVPLTGLGYSLVIDGHPTLGLTEIGYRILLTNQTTSSENGIYVYNDDGMMYTLTRATDADPYTELIGAAVFVKEGDQYGSTAWVQSEHYLTSFAGQVWTQFSGTGTYTASQGVSLVGNDFRFAPKSDGGLQTGTSGASIKLQTNSGLGTTSDGVAVGAGTGISVSGGNVAIDTAVVARKYSVAVGNNVLQSITVTHNLGTRDVQVTLRETASPYAQVECDVEMTDTNSVTLGFAVAPTSNQYTVTVIG